MNSSRIIIIRSIDKLYRESIESAIDYWGIYAQKPAWYFNKKERSICELKVTVIYPTVNHVKHRIIRRYPLPLPPQYK
jgi:hypothetical protein